VLETRPDAVLMACFSEYLSPFWAPLYRRLARRGIPIGTIAHDPVRDYVVGPRWWHRWSVRQGYSFVSDVFAHDDTPVDFGGMNPAMVPVHVIPHGPFEVAAPQLGRDAVRGRHGFAASDRVFLSFGQIRDGKNLDRFLRAMTALPPAVKLLVAGASGGSGQRQPDGYQTMARELGIADRCVWDIRHVPDAEIGDLFSAADIVLMTYSARFRSASGVLNTAVTCRRPVLASAGGGPLKSMVERHRLGVFVRPDDDAAVLEGARRLLGGPPAADWDRYERDNTWRENARIVIEVFGRRAAR
jgi:glycosyltransferase involved in cell wall biosynthesis